MASKMVYEIVGEAGAPAKVINLTNENMLRKKHLLIGSGGSVIKAM
jgi:hypothetical protein